MTKKREITHIVITILLMTLILCFYKLEIRVDKILPYFLISLIIIFSSVFSKKITGSIIDLEIDIKIWEWKRYWFAKISELQKPIPMGLILPLLLGFLSNGFVKFLGFFEFDIIPLPGRVVKKYGAKRFSKVMDWDNALIVFYSTIPLLFLATIAHYLNTIFLNDLAKFSILYVFCNLLPISKLDGTKLYFGSRPLFFFTWILFLIAAIIVILL